jgi:multicomponent Na+:H+ antiporter subunit C
MIEFALACLIGLLFAVSVYLLLARSIVRLLIGVFVLSNAVHLMILTVGRVTREVPAIIPLDAKTLSEQAANSLPQALILTAIVISFALFAFLLVLALRAHREIGARDIDDMRLSEPTAEAQTGGLAELRGRDV